MCRKYINALFRAAKETTKQTASQTVPPGEEFFTSSQEPVILTAHDIDLIEQAQAELVAIGGVTYKDVFGNPHETESCRSIVYKPLTVWHFCSIHNVRR